LTFWRLSMRMADCGRVQSSIQPERQLWPRTFGRVEGGYLQPLARSDPGRPPGPCPCAIASVLPGGSAPAEMTPVTRTLVQRVSLSSVSDRLTLLEDGTRLRKVARVSRLDRILGITKESTSG
jgi:hypothetical protein